MHIKRYLSADAPAVSSPPSVAGFPLVSPRWRIGTAFRLALSSDRITIKSYHHCNRGCPRSPSPSLPVSPARKTPALTCPRYVGPYHAGGITPKRPAPLTTLSWMTSSSQITFITVTESYIDTSIQAGNYPSHAAPP